MQTQTYGAVKTPKSTALNTSAYTQPQSPLSTLFGIAKPPPVGPNRYQTGVPGLTGAGGAATGPSGSPSIHLPAVPGPAHGLFPLSGGSYTNDPFGNQPIGGNPSGAGSPFAFPSTNDLTQDPAYQAVSAAGQRNVADANTSALAQAKNELIGYGAIGPDAKNNLASLFQADPNNPILGALSDTNTLQAAANNPNAALNELAYNDQQRVGQLDSDLNDKNLYYSSTRAAQLANDANTYRGEQAGATSQLSDALSQIYGNVLNAKLQAQEDQNNALQQAWNNYLAYEQNTGAPSDVNVTDQHVTDNKSAPQPNNGPGGPGGVEASKPRNARGGMAPLAQLLAPARPAYTGQ